jgi:hypothetical protein
MVLDSGAIDPGARPFDFGRWILPGSSFVLCALLFPHV